VADFARSEPRGSSQLAASGRAPFRSPGFTLRELTPVPKIRIQALRGRTAGPQESLPATPNTVSGTDPVFLWRAPADWLAYSALMPLATLVAAVGKAAPDCVLTDMSSGLVLLELAGPKSVDILMRDCTLDLDGGEVSVGRCAHTVLAQVNVTLHCCGPEPAWRVFVERSVCLHLWDWLVDSAGLCP